VAFVLLGGAFFVAVVSGVGVGSVDLKVAGVPWLVLFLFCF